MKLFCFRLFFFSIVLNGFNLLQNGLLRGLPFPFVFLEIFLIGWFFKPEKLRREANQFSNFSIGKWWIYAIKIITVIGLGAMLILNLKDTIISGYGGYGVADITVFGWGLIFLCVVATIVLTLLKGREGYDKIPDEDDISLKEKEAE